MWLRDAATRKLDGGPFVLEEERAAIRGSGEMAQTRAVVMALTLAARAQYGSHLAPLRPRRQRFPRLTCTRLPVAGGPLPPGHAEFAGRHQRQEGREKEDHGRHGRR